MTSSPSALVAVPGFSSFHFRFAPSDKRTFCHSSLVTLYPAPLSPLDDNGSIAWSVRALVQYIKTNTWPSKLQSSLLGYFPGLYKTATGDTDAPSRHSSAARLLLLLLSLSPHSASAPRRSSSIASCINYPMQNYLPAFTTLIHILYTQTSFFSPNQLRVSSTRNRQPIE